MKQKRKEYSKVKEKNFLPEHYTLDLLYIRMICELNELKKHNYYLMNRNLIDQAEQSMCSAFKSRSQEDINAFNRDLQKILKSGNNSALLARAMGWLMVGSIVLTLACTPAFLASYLHMVTLPMWLDLTVMSIFCATSVIYLVCQYVQGECLSQAKHGIFKLHFAQTTQALADEQMHWQLHGELSNPKRFEK